MIVHRMALLVVWVGSRMEAQSNGQRLILAHVEVIMTQNNLLTLNFVKKISLKCFKHIFLLYKPKKFMLAKKLL